MNVAILFDGTEAMEVRADMLLAGKKLYSYSLKAFYLHPVIDYIVILWSGCKVGLQIEKDIERWKAEYGVDKPVRVESGTVDLRHIRFPFSGDLNGIEKWKIDLYVLHDVRYPFVTMDMICRVTQKAAIYGAAVLSDKSTRLEEEFVNNKEIILFELAQIGALPKRIKALLSKDKEIKEIAENGRKKAMEKHLWKHRAKELLEIISENG